ncbi:MAG: two-CW domain-containing protein [Candidatus Magnetobacterium sp. LHC-1]|uniref:Uncharacterized protein n=1 Tax=Candidatus Magnetobacterium casense TaxID=1455061 RepID=A0ABS6RUF3_9BACT|nr:hypothetical protein [Candidatus Magnetobacterium casensis]MBF0336833.1 hypothetical protein [Nitrospirota bacterium]MBV6340257.1 hypothetical protein [Candidatus Magnetobacterium casensis]
MEKVKKKPCPGRMAYETLVKAFEKLDISKKEREPCWQAMKCPSQTYTRCPAYLHEAGRRCWLLAGTFSGKDPYCIYCVTVRDCRECRFYKLVRQNL